jgi:AraC family transcriptional regulator
MEYISAQQAGQLWNNSPRQVQTLCKKGKIPGAVRFTRIWAIPKDAEKPLDGRLTAAPKTGGVQNAVLKDERPDIFRQMFEQFPYAIQVFSADGTLQYANQAFFDLFLITDKAQMLGKMNILNDHAVRTTGMMDYVLRALSGESIYLADEPAPLQTVLSQYGGAMLPTSIKYSDILTFPMKKEGKPEYIVVVFRQSRDYEGRREYIKAKEYIDNNWERFDIDATAKAAGLSRSRLTKIFKELASISPWEYCMRVRINKIKEKLADPNLSVSQAFAACGVDYNGHYARIFKQYTGLTPLQYRKSLLY